MITVSYAFSSHAGGIAFRVGAQCINFAILIALTHPHKHRRSHEK
jgi:hypothetical protein